MKNKPIRLVLFSDMHTGGTTSLHPNVKKDKNGKWIPVDLTGWGYINNPQYRLSSEQVEIWKHLNACLAVAANRQDKKIILLNCGDAIEGAHHGTLEIATSEAVEQKETHIQLMQYILEKLKWSRGDMLFYLAGTSAHVGNEETGIAAQLGGVQFSNGLYSASFLELDLNGSLIWAYHKGVTAGSYPNRGNAAVNKMKSIYSQCLSEEIRVPDLILSGHVHDPLHATWTTPRGNTMHYVILPSWQNKTRYVRDNMPTNINKIGMQYIDIDPDGGITIPPPLLLKSKIGEVVKV